MPITRAAAEALCRARGIRPAPRLLAAPSQLPHHLARGVVEAAAAKQRRRRPAADPRPFLDRITDDDDAGSRLMEAIPEDYRAARERERLAALAAERRRAFLDAITD